MTEKKWITFEEYLSRLPEQTWWEWLCYRVRNAWPEFFYWCKKQYQRVTTGFPHEESWNLNDAHARWITPRLKHLRAYLNGHPADMTHEEWEGVLDKMIWAFENFDNNPGPLVTEDWGSYSTEIEGTDLFSMHFTGETDYTPVEEWQARVKEGVDLFAQYYGHLWD